MKTLSMNERRGVAISLYDAALSDPDNANWQYVAVMLRACVAMPKAAVPYPSAKGFAPWHDDERPHKLKRANGKRVIRVLFVDGRETVASASDEGKFNIGRALRVACTMYRHQVRRSVNAYGPPAPKFWEYCPVWEEMRPRLPDPCDCWVGHIPVAEIESVRCDTTGDAWDPAVANAETESYRAGGETREERRARFEAGNASLAAEIEAATAEREARVWTAIWSRQPEREGLPEPVPEPVAPEPVRPEPSVRAILDIWASVHSDNLEAFHLLARRKPVEPVAPIQVVTPPPAPPPVPVRVPVPFHKPLSARELRLRAAAGTLPAWGTVPASIPVNVGV